MSEGKVPIVKRPTEVKLHYLGFTADLADEEIVSRFEARTGQKPAEIVRAPGHVIVLAGPVAGDSNGRNPRPTWRG